MYSALSFDRFGEPAEVLQIVRQEENELPSDFVRVKMIAAPINPSDLIPITGAYRHRTKIPMIPGYEGIGQIVQLGKNVKNLQLGQRILPLQGNGTWSDFVDSPADFAFPVPDELSDLTACQLYINPLTAYILCTQVLKLQAGQILAVNACGSAIGKLFAQLSTILGFELIAIVRNDKHTEKLLELGALRVFNTANESLSELPILDAAIDSIGGFDGTELAKKVKTGGKFETLGLFSGQQVDWQMIAKLPITAEIFHLRHWNAKLSVAEWQEMMTTVVDLVRSNQLKIENPVKIFHYKDYKKALESEFAGKKILQFMV